MNRTNMFCGHFSSLFAVQCILAILTVIILLWLQGNWILFCGLTFNIASFKLGNCMTASAVVQQQINPDSGVMAGENVMPILHYAPLSPPCRSVLLLGRILNIGFDLRVVDVLKGDNMKSEFIEINPQHTIPTLEDHGLILWESRVILSYLVAAYSKDDILYPSDIRMRAIVDQRLQFDLSTLAARTGDYFFSALFTGVLDDTKKTKLIEALGFFEMMLKGRTWAAVNNFTIADLALTITVAQLVSLRFDLEPFSRIRTWLERCKEFLQPHGYDEIQKGSDDLADLFREKLNL